MTSFEKHPQWKDVLHICTTLKEAGFVAWLAGGCVRDFLMGVEPQDFDVATNALPDEVQKLFKKSIDVGKSFGIIMIPFENFRVEIATFRSDGNYLDGRRPEKVVFSTPAEDAERRDFTVNALFLDPFSGEVKDFVEGQKDLKLKILKAVGNPQKRFEEDKLRMLRAVRFSSQLDFQIEASTLKAIQNMADQIDVISKERIHYEFKRMMETSRAARGLKIMDDVGILKVILKPIYDRNNIELGAQLVETAEKLTSRNDLDGKNKISPDEKALLLWLPFLFAMNSPYKNMTVFLKDMKYSQKQMDLYTYVTDALQKIDSEKLSKADLYQIVFHEFGKSVLRVGRVYWADKPNSLKRLNEAAVLLQDFSKLPVPLITGDDLKSLGVSPSPQMKLLLKSAYDYQLENKIVDKKQMLIWTKDLIS